MATLDQLKDALAEARGRLARLNFGGGADEALWREWEFAIDDVLRAERQLAEADGGEYAATIPFEFPWDIGAPMPQLVVASGRTLLSFQLRDVDPGWDGSYAKMVSPQSVAAHGLVTFHRVVSVRMGSPNDEVFAGHPLEGRGREANRVQVVRRSRWLSEIERINSVHRGYRPEAWKSINHFIFWFHDEIVECLAESFTAERRVGSSEELLAEMCRRASR